MTIVAFFDLALLATLPGRTVEPAVMDRHGTVRSGGITLYGRNPFAHLICVQPHEGKRKPTTNTVWTAVEDYTWFEAFSEEGCATGIACTPATHMQSERKTIDERGEG